MKTYFTIYELSLYLKVSKPTIHKWVARNIIPYIRINKRVIRFDKDRIDVWFAGFENQVA